MPTDAVGSHEAMAFGVPLKIVIVAVELPIELAPGLVIVAHLVHRGGLIQSSIDHRMGHVL